MNIVHGAQNIAQGATQVVTKAANVTTAAAGAVGGAAVNGVIGGAKGAVGGVRTGAESGSHSTPAALLTLSAVGASGLIAWPVVLAVGGTALLVRQFTRANGDDAAEEPPRLRAVGNGSGRNSAQPARKATTKSTPRKTTKSTARKTTARKTTARKTTTSRSSR